MIFNPVTAVCSPAAGVVMSWPQMSYIGEALAISGGVITVGVRRPDISCKISGFRSKSMLFDCTISNTYDKTGMADTLRLR